MNNIYKVIWSKAKNCYVVASEIARSHTKSATGSEKIGGVTRRSLLASLMALSLLCGGLGVAEAAVVHVDEVPGGTKTVYTTEDTYTRTDIDGKLDLKANAADVNNELAKKADTANVYTRTEADSKLDLKANAADVNNELAKKADAANVYSRTEADSKLDLKANAVDVNNELAKKADKTYVDNAVANVNTKLADYAKTTDVYDKGTVDGKITAEETARKAADAALDTRLTTAEGKIGDNKTAIDALKAKDTALEGEITRLDGSGVKYDTAVKDTITLKGPDGTKITHLKDATLSDSSTDAVTGRQLNKTNENLAAETAARENKDNELDGKITTLDGKVTTDINELKAKDTDLANKIQTNAADIQTNKNAIAATDKRTGGITRNDAATETKIEGNVTVDNLGNVTAKGNVTADGKLKGDGVDAGTGDITTDGAVNAGSLKVENDSKLKGDVTMDKKLSVTGDTSLGKTDVGGALNVTGESNLQGNVILGKNTANTVTVNGKSDFKEAVEMDNGLTVTSGDTTLKGKLTVTDDAELKNTTVDGTLGVTGATTLEGTLTAEKDATFEKDVTVKGTTNLKDTTVKGDLNVTGTITTDKMVFGDKVANNYTEIDHGKVTSKNVENNGAGQLISSSSIFNAEENKVGFANNATGDQSFHKQTSDIIMDNVKDRENSNNRTQTKTETKDIITDKDGNSSTTSQTASENKTYLKDKDGKNTNSTIDTAKGYDKTIKGENGETSTKQDELNITNTAQNGTITNDAMNIVNNASGNMTNTVGGDLTTTVSGNELHEVTGTKTENVTGKVTENYKAGQETNVTGDQDIYVTGKQTNKIDGDQVNIIGGNQTTTVTGDFSNKTENITNEANTKLTDKVDDNTRVLDSEGITDTVPGADGKGSTFKQRIDAIMGNVKTDAGESEVTQKGDEITSKVGLGEATNSRVTQKKDLLEAAVTDGTNYNISNDTANESAKELRGGTKVNRQYDNLNGSQKTITNGTYTTSKLQTALDITNTAKDGTITNDAKDIVNNASGNMTNTVGGDLTTTVAGNELHEVTGNKTENVTGKVTENYGNGQETNVTGDQYLHVTGKQTNKIDGNQENTIGGNQTTTVTGDISNKAENITNEANTKLTDKVGDHTRVLDSEGITDTVGGSTFKQRIDKIMMESKDVSIKAEETLTNEAKVITNKASEVINNEAVNINNTATGIITSKASEIKNQADKLISNKVGENTWENMENGKITTSIKDGAKQNLTQSNAAGTTQSTVDVGKSTVTIQNADGLVDVVTDGTNTSVQNQTASQIAAAVKDGAGNENASVATATTSANTIKSGSKANTVISTADGTSFINSEAAAPVTGASGAGTAVNTTIKGNTITTGKVTMDYAEVMKDLGVRGNANITGKTTTGSLEVTGTSTLKGDVTMESNATVNGNFSVGGNTNLKNTEVDGTLNVTQKATFGDSVSIAKDLSVGGDVTANSYKVGDKTYIDANGINANDQKITNVADGSISEGSKDAVNGGQLYGVKRDLEHQVDKVGANAAAMANLRPMEFDPSSKWNIAAAIGNYGSETAAALGAFYRPNDDVMVNLSTAFGTGENMVGGGVSVRLGKGGNKLSREENNALKDQVNDLTARMDALLSVLNPNMSKDFPDVPENHWAYEAVSRLAGNDIVQGYPDGEFHGERTMTRYEMAEIIYNALSRGAEAERELVEEFKPELQAMAASEKATAEKAEG